MRFLIADIFLSKFPQRIRANASDYFGVLFSREINHRAATRTLTPDLGAQSTLHAGPCIPLSARRDAISTSLN